MDPDTNIGGFQQKFPATNHSAIVAVRSEDSDVRQRGFETILHSYWKPVYKYIRFKWHATNEDAKDLTQGFFANALEKNHFASYDARKASFQTYLRTCLDGFVSNVRKGEGRLKRGGGYDHFSLDFAGAEGELSFQLPAPEQNPEDFFYREWVRHLFATAVADLRERSKDSGRQVHFRLFERYDLATGEGESKPSYASLAHDFALDTNTVNNHLASIRREFRKVVLERLREITATEEEFHREARSLLGVRLR
jgi:RNA polymerase sigma factor (sigma-70 family)